MSKIKNDLIYDSKPYGIIGGVSIFPLNDNGVRNYLKNKLVDNQLIKKYGTMNFLEDCDQARENRVKENERNFFSSSKPLALDNRKNLLYFDEDFNRVKNNFNEDIVKLNIMLNTLKEKNKNTLLTNQKIPNDKNDNSRDINEIIRKFPTAISYDTITKLKTKRNLGDRFTSKSIPKFNSTDDKIKNQYFLNLMKNNHQKISDSQIMACPTIFPKVFDYQKIKLSSDENLFENKVKSSNNLFKTTQAEFVYNSNFKGNCKMMGEKYNPYNYYVDNPKTTKKRNSYGSLFNN